jgi:predicted GNAT superfamily acetyltransferase
MLQKGSKVSVSDQQDSHPSVPAPSGSLEQPLSPALLGFEAHADVTAENGETLVWTKRVGGRAFTFRILRTIAELEPTEDLQHTVFGVSDRDLIPANQLIGAYESGGDVLGAFTEIDGVECLAGHSVSLGGYFRGRPRLVSDFLVVREELRSFGLGAELKKLQAAIAHQRGFTEIVWTVDPLRSANARLNVEKLGAVSNHYEINRYGEGYGSGLYGGMPTDRLHMSWQIDSRRVRERIQGERPPMTADDIDDLLHYDPGKPQAERSLVHIPADIDQLLAVDPNAALRWRLSLRDTLPAAFAAGYVITGFVARSNPDRQLSSYVLSKTDETDPS